MQIAIVILLQLGATCEYWASSATRSEDNPLEQYDVALKRRSARAFRAGLKVAVAFPFKPNSPIRERQRAETLFAALKRRLPMNLMDRAMRAYFQNSRGDATMQPSAFLSEVVTVNGCTEVLLRNGPHGLLAKYIVCKRANVAGLVTDRLRSVPIDDGKIVNLNDRLNTRLLRRDSELTEGLL